MTTATDKAVREIRWHGRGGQGTVTAAKMLASAAIIRGKYGQAMPEFGLERSGTPVKVSTRISDNPINTRAPVDSPEIVIITDPSLMFTTRDIIVSGTDENTIFIVNTNFPPEKVRQILGIPNNELWIVDASKIAMEEFGRNIPNTAVLGAVAKATGLVDLEALEQEITEAFGASSKLRNVLEQNLKALRRGYEEVYKA
ncbi:2-oxoacid:acceptor oxidoreductase family protein [Sulfurihydrogenibium sp.]|jgi:pyruvate ferredoxin oxidoreductase gamma subunit|uniref:2-oxoacid:acceptor oxidoreductase family protein n=1 Tax=Sulfurihydrogenibium sp. TaxID=2053621 RepID=UPI0026041FE1|nr:2-oxoacid:acceptor oxidoreductase family protein [Sulfurihydrogenibium sp.]